MENLYEKLNEISTKLDEWYKCLPFEALNTIHSIDLFSMSENEVQEVLDEYYVDWEYLPIGDKVAIYETLKEKYQSFTNHINF